MPRYLTRSSYWDDAVGLVHQPESATVLEAEAIDTGILDAQGNPIFKRAIGPIGFDISGSRREELHDGKTIRLRAGVRRAGKKAVRTRRD